MTVDSTSMTNPASGDGRETASVGVAVSSVMLDVALCSDGDGAMLASTPAEDTFRVEVTFCSDGDGAKLASASNVDELLSVSAAVGSIVTMLSV